MLILYDLKSIYFENEILFRQGRVNRIQAFIIIERDKIVFNIKFTNINAQIIKIIRILLAKKLKRSER